MKYFSYDPDKGSETHNTAQLDSQRLSPQIAEEAAYNSIDYYRENAQEDGWDEEVGEVSWGEIRQRAKCIELSNPDEDGCCFARAASTSVLANYELQDV